MSDVGWLTNMCVHSEATSYLAEGDPDSAAAGERGSGAFLKIPAWTCMHTYSPVSKHCTLSSMLFFIGAKQLLIEVFQLPVYTQNIHRR